ncbi:hypothetical protein D9M71_627770 [compost metagenome]
MTKTQVEECGYRYAADSGCHGECGLAQAGQCTLVDFAADLHAHDQEKDGHQAIIDPEMQRLRIDMRAYAERQRRMPKGFITVGSRGIRPNQCSDCGNQQNDAADRFNVQKAFKVGEGTLSQFLGAR